MDNTLDDQFVLVHSDNLDEIETQLESLNVQIVELEKRNKKLEEEHQNLEKRHGDLLKLMNEILKIKPSSRIDRIENLEEVRQRITQILYNEIRRHTVFSFSPILNSYSIYPSYDNLNVD